MMRLLFDQNISYRVVKQLKTTLPDSIGEYARREDYVVVTFDKDIPLIGSVKGFPPKIIWLRTGNIKNQVIIDLFTNRREEFIQFINRQNKGCLLVYQQATDSNPSEV